MDTADAQAQVGAIEVRASDKETSKADYWHQEVWSWGEVRISPADL